MSSLTIISPSKLFLCGEYAVLDNQCPAYIMAVDPQYRISVADASLPADSINIDAPDLDLQLQGQWTKGHMQWKGDHMARKKLNFASEAAQFACHYIDQRSNLKLPLQITMQRQEWSAPEQASKGLGGSAAVCVGVVSAILAAHGISIDKHRKDIFRLAYLAHFKAQGLRGSGGDIAASVYGGVIRYCSPDKEWLAQHVEAKCGLEPWFEEEWPGLLCEPLGHTLPTEMAVAWSGEAASTTKMVKRVQKKLGDNDRFKHVFLSKSTQAAVTMHQAMEANDSAIFLKAVAESHAALLYLQEMTQSFIYTPALKTLVDTAEACGAKAKLSGAGGGDCGIAFLEADKRQELYAAWEAEDLTPLPITSLSQGVRLA